MSRHQAVRNLDYHEVLDEADGYSDDHDDELSAEDQARMTQGTVEVRACLGSHGYKVANSQIEEALWHYYYDVDKSVAYLVSKFVAPAAKPAKPTPTTKSSVDVGLLGNSKPCRPSGRSPLTLQEAASVHRHSFSTFFWDMPWGQVPKHREALFVEPRRPRGGLLGGSATPPISSKLAQLAAARKRKLDEKKYTDNVEPTGHRLAELSINNDATEKGALRFPSTETVRLPPREAPAREKRLKTDAKAETKAQSPMSPGHAEFQPEPAVQAAWEVVKHETPCLMAKPSAFASALFGSPSHMPKRAQTEEHFPLPYLAFLPSLDAFSGPSPDDVVLAAQAKAGKTTPAQGGLKTKGGPKKSGTGEDLAAQVDDMSIGEPALPKSKNLDVLSEYERSKSKKTASFVVVGHVDAGKSTMMGRLLLDLGVVDQRTVDKLRREAEKIGKASFALAWVLDQRSEERARGVTIDIATNRFETDSTAFTILDAPGHRDFIPNMIAGASQADFAILVIDASPGAFESGLKGQTKEHSLLIRSMGVKRVIVAVNKLDTVLWSKERFDEIKDQVTGFLTAKNMGFQSKNIVFVPVSGLHGDNLTRKSEEPAASWYTGSTLVGELEKSEPSARALTKPLRMTISDIFRTVQSPLSISGRIDAGSLQTGDAILVQPSGEKAYVKSLLVEDQPTDWAVAGQNAVIHLSNIDPIHVRMGDMICDTAKPIECRETFSLKALAFDFLMPMQVDVHRGRLHAAGRIDGVSAVLDKVTGAVTRKRPQVVKPGSTARLTITLSAKVPLETGQRVVLRSGGETIAAGLLE